MASIDHRQILMSEGESLRQAIEVIENGNLQIALVLDQAGCLKGTVTDGDIRRGILRGVGLDDGVDKVMNNHPMSAPAGTPKDKLLALMDAKTIKHMPLVDAAGRVVGLEVLDPRLVSPSVKENVVIILAGGQGKRLRPLTDNTPKPLLKVGDRPVLERTLDHLKASGFRRFYISVNYLGSQIEEYFGDGHSYGVEIEYLREPEPLGTAGSLALFPGVPTSPVIVINGDLLTTVNFDQMLDFHRDGGYHITMGVKEYPFQIPFGVVTTENERVVAFNEKPTETRLINTGVYILEPAVLNDISKNTHQDMNKVLEYVLEEGTHQLGAFLIHEYWIDIGTADDFQQARLDHDLQTSP